MSKVGDHESASFIYRKLIPETKIMLDEGNNFVLACLEEGIYQQITQADKEYIACT